VDLVYADGSPLWGQTASFHTGTHGWERRDLTILPAKPVRSLTLYCLFRGHTGKVWFDDLALQEPRASGGAMLYQGVPVRWAKAWRPAGAARTLSTRDGLTLGLRGDSVGSVRLDGRELAASTPSGFLARDVSAESGFHFFGKGACSELGLRLSARYEARESSIAVSGRLTSTRRADRAVTLVFALPLSGSGWTWGDDIQARRPATGALELANLVSVGCGSTGTQSLYPLGCVWRGRDGLAVGLDMGSPAQFRIAFHPSAKQLLIAFDFGLVPETRRFPSSADYRFVLYRFDGRQGFRGALDRYMRLFPAYFAVRSESQGIWMPFTDVSTVQGYQDFGFRYHEGNNNVPFDDAHGVLSFRYTEPMTWWMPMAQGVPRTPAEAVRARDALAAGGTGQAPMARAARAAGMEDDRGEPALLFRSEPWCDGAVWSLNPNPSLPGDPNGASVHWSPTIRRELYGPNAKGRLDGEYLDSLEGYVTADLNYRRSHFALTSVPLTFDTVTHRPALHKGLAVYEFTRWLAQDVRRLGKLTFANGVPYRFTYLCPWLDVMGTETNWLSGGRYSPPPDSQLCLWRSMSGAKPYLLLMNTDYDAFTPAMVEAYFRQSLFYGFYPSMFSHNAAENPYWQNPKWYNRDRPLFVKYQPIIRRVAEAGWRPVTSARCDNPALRTERFGPDSEGAVYLTAMNTTDRQQSGRLTVDAGALRLRAEPKAQELLSGRMVPFQGSRTTVRLGASEVWALRLR
jgi:hypothetical protein